MGLGGQPHSPAATATGKDPLPVVQEAGFAPGPVLTSTENLAPTGFDPPTVQPYPVAILTTLPGRNFRNVTLRIYVTIYR